MRKNLKLLDCTLRDGGFVNDWMFGFATIRSVISRLDASGVDIIECGFLDDRVLYDKNRTLFPNIPSIAKTLKSASPRRASIIAMIDYGTYRADLLIPQKESLIDGIRLIFKKEHVDLALEYALKIKELGFNLFLNPVALTSYRDTDVIELMAKINQIQPYGVSIVDTYGLMFENDVDKFISLLDNELDENIALGYHCHNNVQMANAHCLRFISKNLKREMIVDCSILGMGKNAGNACTELIGLYLSKNEIKNLDMNHVLTIAYTDISRFTSKSNWGYGLDSLLSAIHDCSPKWIDFLMSKNTLSVQSIRSLLDTLPFEKREVSFFNEELAEQKYIEHISTHVSDNDAIGAFTELLQKDNRKILLLCPGKSLYTHRDDINVYITQSRPIVISVNFITDFMQTDYAFISNSNRYSQVLGLYEEVRQIPEILLTSNVIATEALKPLFTFSYKSLYDIVNGDNSVVLLISLLKRCGIYDIAIAGMDGYDKTKSVDNYFDASMNIGSIQNDNTKQEEQLARVIDDEMNITLITPSTLHVDFLISPYG